MKKIKTTFMYRNELSGVVYFAATRKELVNQVAPYGSPRVSIMYRDKADGSSVRCGYVIGSQWLTTFLPFEVKITH